MMHKNPRPEHAVNTPYPLQGWKLKKKLFTLIKLSYNISTNTIAYTITTINLYLSQLFSFGYINLPPLLRMKQS